MRCRTSWLGRPAIAALALMSITVACDDLPDLNVVTPIIDNNNFALTKLVADATSGGAPNVDPNLINPWGIAFGPTGLLWSANNGTGTATVYDAAGVPQSLVVDIPTVNAATGGRPTGVVLNTTPSFPVPNAGISTFIFAGEDGIISAWNSATVDARVVADRSASGSVYKGIAISSSAGANFVFATDFRNGVVDIFDANFHFVRSFTDPGIPAGYGPFGIQAISGKLYVTYAKQEAPDNEDDVAGVGNGFVDVFNTDGTLDHRFASNGSLNAPWAIAMAPAGFGPFSGAILIGNFGDGKIGAYNPGNGAFIDFLKDGAAAPISIPGLWGLTFGPGVGALTLYFAAGPGDEAHGLIGKLAPR